MTPEEKRKEEELADIVKANLPALAAVDAANRANTSHIALSGKNERRLVLMVDPAERRHQEMMEALRDLKPKPRPIRKDIITGKELEKHRPKPCERRVQIEKFLRNQLKALALFRERDYGNFVRTINHNTKQEFARRMGMPVSTFGRLVNSNETLKRLCAAVMDEDLFRLYLRGRSTVV